LLISKKKLPKEYFRDDRYSGKSKKKPLHPPSISEKGSKIRLPEQNTSTA
jgi:hypothetical protein